MSFKDFEMCTLRYDTIRYSTASTIKDVEQAAIGNLVWNNDIITTATNLDTQLSVTNSVFFNGST